MRGTTTGIRLALVGLMCMPLVGWGAATAPDTPTGRCSLSVQYLPQLAGSVAILARAQPDTVAVRLSDLPEGLTRRGLAPGDRNVVFGQRFEVLRVSDRGSGLAVTVGDAVTVVPWGYRGDCAAIPWDTSAAWVPVGSEVLLHGVTSEFTASSLPLEVHVLGWHQPYPTGAFLKYDVPRVQRQKPWLSSAQLFELMTELPAASDHESRRRPEVLRALEEWKRQNPTLSRHFPVSKP